MPGFVLSQLVSEHEVRQAELDLAGRGLAQLERWHRIYDQVEAEADPAKACAAADADQAARGPKTSTSTPMWTPRMQSSLRAPTICGPETDPPDETEFDSETVTKTAVRERREQLLERRGVSERARDRDRDAGGVWVLVRDPNAEPIRASVVGGPDLLLPQELSYVKVFLTPHDLHRAAFAKAFPHAGGRLRPPPTSDSGVSRY